MKTIQEMLQELSQCIVTVSGEFRFRTNWNGGKVPQPDLDAFDPNVPFCIENVGDIKASIQYNTNNTNIRISKDYKTWNDYTSGTEIELNPKDRVYIKSDYVKDASYKPHFVFNGDGTRLRARGNIASLIYGTDDTYVNKYTATEEYCYAWMFYECRSLTQAPALPATTLADYCYNYMFSGCTSLTQAPELPATTLADSCYQYMFRNCASLTQAPELPATTLTDECYHSMFSGCKALVNAPKLPATTLTDGCYYSMFSDCTSLVQVPELPATTLADYCYFNMFSGCTSLVQAPELPATTLADYCYKYMFDGCTSLVRAPELPATTLYESCYQYMFQSCVSLAQAPELPATTLYESCYQYMFRDCTKLNYVKCLATDTSAAFCTTNWLLNVSATGTFECDNKKYFTIDSPKGIPVGWTITEINPDVEKPDLDTFDPNVPFCIENVGDVPVEIGLYNTGKKAVRSNCKISTNLKTWSDYNLVLTDDDTSNDIGRISLQNKGDRVYIKADITPLDAYPPFPFPHTQLKVFDQSESKKIRARGNIASLNYGTNDAYVNKYTSTEAYCYYSMFSGCTSLIQTPELPATTLAGYCYSDMFYDCTSLIQAPELPATTLADSCYYSMFEGCTSLTQAPELPATTLARNCYSYMFCICTSLTQAPELPATTLAFSCYDDMFSGCTSLTQAPALPATTLADYCYYYMFSGCKSLTQAPELPATTLATGCYGFMFNGCTSLTQAPELPVTTLAGSCYYKMFIGCTKLNYVKCLATDTSATDCTSYWLYHVAAKGDFYTPASTNWEIDSVNGIPYGWTRHDIT